jgi:hypothetical protein
MSARKHLDHGKGYRQKKDKRDGDYLLAQLLAAAEPEQELVSQAWKPGPILDQGKTSSCVGHGCYQLLKTEPFLHTTTLTPFTIYGEARKIDEFPDNVEGTSVRAGLKVLQAHGHISNYYWARDTDEMIRYLITHGPLIVGTSWLSGMESVDAEGFIKVRGADGGGHCYVIGSYLREKDAFALVNSWGLPWGIEGGALVRVADFQKLLNQGGVAAAVVETPK